MPARSLPVDHSKTHRRCSSPELLPIANSRVPSGEKASEQMLRVKQGRMGPPAPGPVTTRGGGRRRTGEAWRLTPSTYGYTPADETLLVTGTFRLPTWRAGRAG